MRWTSVAVGDRGTVAHAVLVLEGTFEHVADDLHVAMPVGAEALTGRDAVLVDHPERTEPHVGRVVVIGEGEAVAGVEPPVAGVASVLALPDGHHDRNSSAMNGDGKDRDPRLLNKQVQKEFFISFLA